MIYGHISLWATVLAACRDAPSVAELSVTFYVALHPYPHEFRYGRLMATYP